MYITLIVYCLDFRFFIYLIYELFFIHGDFSLFFHRTLKNRTFITIDSFLISYGKYFLFSFYREIV
jgi:hypothetical protein